MPASPKVPVVPRAERLTRSLRMASSRTELKLNKIKKYEYGCKASLVVTQNSGIIVGAMTFARNRYDGHTWQEGLAQSHQLTGLRAKTATVDRGYKGAEALLGTQINRPKPASSKDTAYQRRKRRNHFRRRAAIEAVIGHLT